MAAIFNQRSFTQARSAKQCRERWNNYANPEINKSTWSEEEKIKIYELRKTLGNKWAAIAKQMNGRTENAVKNLFYSDQRKIMRKHQKKEKNLNRLEPSNDSKTNNEYRNIELQSQDSSNIEFLYQNSNFMSEIMQNVTKNFVTLTFPFLINKDFSDYSEILAGYGNNIDQIFQFFPFFSNNQGLK